MDPISDLCRERPFGKFYNPENSIIINWLVFVEDIDHKIDIRETDKLPIDENDKLNKSKKILKTLPSDILLKANPFSNIGKSIFPVESSLIMANLDTVFNITPAVGGYYNLRDDTRGYNYVDIGFSGEGFVNYIQFKEINSVGFGIGLKEYRNGKIIENINFIRFQETPENILGDIRDQEERDTFIKFINKADISLVLAHEINSDHQTAACSQPEIFYGTYLNPASRRKNFRLPI